MKIFAIALSLLLLLAACDGDAEVVAGDTAQNTPPPTARPSTTPSPSPTPSTSVTWGPPPTGGPTELPDGGDLADRVEKADVIVRGSFVKKLPELWNQVRYADDPTQPDPDVFTWEEQYEFQIEEIYKNDEDETLRAGETFVVNLPYSGILFKGDEVMPSERHMEVALREEAVLFLSRDDSVPDTLLWFPEQEPFHLAVRDDRLFAKSYDEAAVGAWNEQMGTDQGVSLESFEEELEDLAGGAR